MIVFITSRGHEYTAKSFEQGQFGFPTPKIRVTHYESLLAARRVPRATYLFTDLERLAPWELRAAADLYRAMRAEGLRCLNDPSKAMSRFELLHALHAHGINPFAVYRGDEQPRPARFPVFLRGEADHGYPVSALIGDQAALDRALETLRNEGTPLRGTMIVEYCADPYRGSLFAKWGTFRVGERIFVDHIAVDEGWLVKYGKWEKLDEAVCADEHDAVVNNRYAAALRSAFELAAIEFGRADHASVGGRTVVYEINTNPMIGRYVPDRKPLRRETQTRARKQLAAALFEIDSATTGTVQLRPTAVTASYRKRRLGWLAPPRP